MKLILPPCIPKSTTCQGSSFHPEAKLCPLRQVLDREEGMNGHCTCSFLNIRSVYWKGNTKGLQADPERFISWISGIFMTYNSTWGDIQSLLTIFLTIKEKMTVLLKAKEEADKHTS